MSSQPEIRYPQLPPDLARGLSWRSLRYFGAGAIVASVTIGSGETVFASRGGAVFGYVLLWCFLGGALMKGIQVYTAARYMTLTGEHPMTHWALFPGPRGWVPVTMGLLSIVCFPFWQASLPLVLGDLLNWAFGITGRPDELLMYKRIWGTLAIVTVMTLTWLQTYGMLERVQTVVVGLLLGCVFVATFACRPDWLQVLAGTFLPRVPQYPEWVVTSYPQIAQGRSEWLEVGMYLGAIGGGTYDYLGYLGCFREKAWGAIGLKHKPYEVDTTAYEGKIPIELERDNLARGRRWLLPAKIDTGVGFFCVLLFTACFTILGARLLHPRHLVPDNNVLLTYQARFLTELHPALLYVYQLGIFMAIFGTIYGAYEIYIRTAFECVMPVSRAARQMAYRHFRAAILLYCGGLALLLMWTYGDPVKMIEFAATVGGVFACGIWCLLMIWTDRRFCRGRCRWGPYC